jgi:hypothetical protein
MPMHFVLQITVKLIFILISIFLIQLLYGMKELGKQKCFLTIFKSINNSGHSFQAISNSVLTMQQAA